MADTYDIVNSLVRTEKGTVLEQDGKYIFSVAKKANKIQIKKAIEDIYKVKVLSVNTMNIRGKMRRVRTELGKTADWKKAVVTLVAGNKIEVT
ncbi:MAG: 50S ribosomal protein L23 [Candidatus Omnitrophica bacterium]|nr:50S ribosomal protein L23 [Candidatus Omnitrophota bacterium]HOX55113.1 50S ribosomal protein L23 [Candidatus Omnitrophota bacterium]